MDAVLCLRETTHFQSMELERPEAICGLESGTRSRLWSTRGDCACRQEVAFFGLRLAGTEIAFVFSLQLPKSVGHKISLRYGHSPQADLAGPIPELSPTIEFRLPHKSIESHW